MSTPVRILALSFKYILVHIFIIYQPILKKRFLNIFSIKKAINRGITRSTLLFEFFKLGLMERRLKITSLDDNLKIKMDVSQHFLKYLPQRFLELVLYFLEGVKFSEKKSGMYIGCL